MESGFGQGQETLICADGQQFRAVSVVRFSLSKSIQFNLQFSHIAHASETET